MNENQMIFFIRFSENRIECHVNDRLMRRSMR